MSLRLLRGDDFISFNADNVTLYPNPNFLCKNEDPSTRRGPIMIQRLRQGGEPHPLCPVEALERYVVSTSLTRSFHLFVHPILLTDMTIHKIRLFLCKFIKLANPDSFPRSHDVRKMASSFAFFRSMDIETICSRVGWSSERVFLRHYLKQVEELSSSVITLGAEVSGSAKSS